MTVIANIYLTSHTQKGTHTKKSYLESWKIEQIEDSTIQSGKDKDIIDRFDKEDCVCNIAPVSFIEISCTR